MFDYALHLIGYGCLGLILFSTATLLGMAVCDCVSSLTAAPKSVRKEETKPLQEVSTVVDTSKEDAEEIAMITKVVEASAFPIEPEEEEDDEQTEESDVAVSEQ